MAITKKDSTHWLLKSLRALLAAVMIAAGCPGAFSAGVNEADTARPFSLTVELAANSRYIWRGILLSQGAVFQPSAGISFGGLTLSLWSNIDLASTAPRPGLNEVDVFLTYSFEVKGLTIEPGLNVFMYPRQGPAGPATTEGTLYLSVPLSGALSVYLDQALDIGAYAGGYFAEAGLSLEKQIRGDFKLEAAICQFFGSATFNRAYWDVSRSMLDACSLRLALTWSPARNLFIRPHMEEIILTSSGIRKAAGRSTCFNFGLTLGVGPS